MEQLNLFGSKPKKLEVSVLESLQYFSKIIIEAPDDITEEKLDQLVSKLERNNRYSDSLETIAKDLSKEKGIKVVKIINHFPDKPQSRTFSFVDIEDYE